MPVIRIYGYHGTNIDFLPDIRQNGFLLSNKWGDWLGKGAYFWQDAPSRAWDWARKRHGDKAAVVRVLIHLDTDNCIDLVDIGWVGQFRQAYADLRAVVEAVGKSLPNQTITFAPGEPHPLDRRVINHFIDSRAVLGQEILAVRGIFLEGEPFYPDSALYTEAHIQVAVRHPDLISDVDELTP
jgi:hypothetical protein